MSNARPTADISGVWWDPNCVGQFVRFLATGACATLLNVVLLWLLCGGLGMPYLPASVLSFSTALLCNFAVQKIWTFSAAGAARVGAQGVQFIATNVFNLALNTGILYLLVERLAVSYLIAQILSSAMVAANSYCAYRWIFHDAQVRLGA